MNWYKFRLITVVMTACYLAGCDLEKSLGGNISGLAEDASLSIEYKGTSYTFSENGPYKLADKADILDRANLRIASDPLGQFCRFTEGMSERIFLKNIDNFNITCIDIPVYQGTIHDRDSQAALAGVTVNVISQNGHGQQTVTDENGQYQFERYHSDSRYSVILSHSGYVPYSKAFVLPDESQQVSTITIEKAASTLFYFYDPALTADQEFYIIGDDVRLHSPEFSLPAGAQVRAEITNLDGSTDISRLPGELSTGVAAGLGADTANDKVDSRGAVSLQFYIDDSEQLLPLSDGTDLSVWVPLAKGITGVDPTPRVNLYKYDYIDAIWQLVGEADYVPEEQAYLLSVQSPGIYNLGLPYDEVLVSGCVDNFADNAQEIEITAQGQDHLAYSTTRILDGLNFTIPVRDVGKTTLELTFANQTFNTLVATTGSDITFDTCIELINTWSSASLSWGQYPGDLDLNVVGPVGSEEEFNFRRDAESSGGIEGGVGYKLILAEKEITLSHDEQNSEAPEVLTFKGFPYPGEYHFYVYHKSGYDDILSSPTTLELAMAESGEPISLTASESTLDTMVEPVPVKKCWLPFSVTVNVELKVTEIVTQDKWIDHSFCE